jgi:hypothetical protein
MTALRIFCLRLSGGLTKHRFTDGAATFCWFLGRVAGGAGGWFRGKFGAGLIGSRLVVWRNTVDFVSSGLWSLGFGPVFFDN